MAASYADVSITPSRCATQDTCAPRRCCASQICPVVGNSISLTTTRRRLPEKSSALATALIASDTELKTAMSSGEAPMSAAKAAFASCTSSIHASQSIPVRFQESRYRSAAARVTSVCGPCEQLFIGMHDARSGMRRRSASMS